MLGCFNLVILNTHLKFLINFVSIDIIYLLHQTILSCHFDIIIYVFESKIYILSLFVERFKMYGNDGVAYLSSYSPCKKKNDAKSTFYNPLDRNLIFLNFFYVYINHLLYFLCLIKRQVQKSCIRYKEYILLPVQKDDVRIKKSIEYLQN